MLMMDIITGHMSAKNRSIKSNIQHMDNKHTDHNQNGDYESDKKVSNDLENRIENVEKKCEDLKIDIGNMEKNILCDKKRKEEKEKEEIKYETNIKLYEEALNIKHCDNHNRLKRTKSTRVKLSVFILFTPIAILFILNMNKDDDLLYNVCISILLLIPSTLLFIMHYVFITAYIHKKYGENIRFHYTSDKNIKSILSIYECYFICKQITHDQNDLISNKNDIINKTTKILNLNKNIFKKILEELDCKWYDKDIPNGPKLVKHEEIKKLSFKEESLTNMSCLKTFGGLIFYNNDNHIVNSCCCKKCGRCCWNLWCCLFCCTSKDNSIYIIE